MPEWLGTLPQWITATSLVAIIAAYWRRGIALKGLENADLADIRTHLATELDRVTKRQRECEVREGELRERLSRAEDEISGLKRQVARYSADQLTLLEQGYPLKAPHASASADRVRKITEGGGK